MIFQESKYDIERLKLIEEFIKQLIICSDCDYTFKPEFKRNGRIL